MKASMYLVQCRSVFIEKLISTFCVNPFLLAKGVHLDMRPTCNTAIKEWGELKHDNLLVLKLKDFLSILNYGLEPHAVTYFRDWAVLGNHRSIRNTALDTNLVPCASKDQSQHDPSSLVHQ